MKNILYNIVLLSLFSGVLYAQEDEEKHDKDLGTVVHVVRAYNPEVSDVVKIKVDPEIDNSDNKKRKLDYKTYKTEVVSTYEPSKMGSKKKSRKKKEKSFNNYIAVGYGNYKTPLVDFYMNNKKVKKQRFGIHIKHLSSEGGIKDVKFNDSYVNTSLDGFYWKQFKNHQLKSTLTYSYKQNNWYGVPDALVSDDLVKNINIGQYYQTIQGDASYEFNGRKRNIPFDKGVLQAYTMWDRYGSRENRAIMDVEFAFPISDFGLNVTAGVDFINNSFEQQYYVDSVISTGYTNMNITPVLEIKGDNYDANIGASFVYSLDKNGDNSKFLVYPKISGSYSVVEGLMIAYAGVDGELKQNSYKDFTTENPFLSPTQNIAPTSIVFNAFGGVRGRLTSNITYDVSASYSKQNGFVQFIRNNQKFKVDDLVNGWEADNSYSVVYDTVHVFGFNAGLDYESNDFNAGINLNTNAFNSTGLDTVYNKPLMKLTINAEYRFFKGFYIGTSMYYVSSRKTVVYDKIGVDGIILGQENLASYFDMNFKAGYDITKQISVFTKFNNVLGNNYEIYRDYPVQGFQFMAGGIYKF
ncbi:MAG: hypothetical protein KAG96_01115 [Ichthyobacteriaceae bacterium]|nr:hypothetical protein [Ichthyobacteriaceae bacterium]